MDSNVHLGSLCNDIVITWYNLLLEYMEIKNGLLPDPKDERDYIFEALGSQPVDWENGYDIEEVIGYKIKPVKNQYNSYSCVGQAFAYYRAVLKSLYNEVSAKSIYSLISLGFGKGSYLRDGAKQTKELGVLLEKDLKSYNNNGVTDETLMTDKSWFTEEVKKEMAKLQTHDYYRVSTMTIDGFAKAIRDGNGMVFGVTGNNNGTWFSVRPVPPTLNTPQNQQWGHAIFGGKFRLNNGKKEIGFLNSWGEACGDKGWQWLGEEWFADDGRWIFNPWILIDKINNNNMSNDKVKILKDANSSAVGVWLPAISEDVLKSYALNMGKTLPLTPDGKIDWENTIEGTFTTK